MIDLGDTQLGREVAVVCQTTNGTSPTAPDAAPILSLFSGTTLVLRKAMPVDAASQIPGVFRLPIFLNSAFTAGPITGFVQWVTGGVVFSETVWMRIVPGGNADGSIIAATYVRRPGTGYLVWQADSGTIFKGTNPRATR